MQFNATAVDSAWHQNGHSSKCRKPTNIHLPDHHPTTTLHQITGQLIDRGLLQWLGYIYIYSSAILFFFSHRVFFFSILVYTPKKCISLHWRMRLWMDGVTRKKPFVFLTTFFLKVLQIKWRKRKLKVLWIEWPIMKFNSQWFEA